MYATEIAKKRPRAKKISFFMHVFLMWSFYSPHILISSKTFCLINKVCILVNHKNVKMLFFLSSCAAQLDLGMAKTTSMHIQIVTKVKSSDD